MRHVMGLAVGAAIAALVLGCSPGKEMPETSLVQKEPETAASDPFGKVPKASDPKAKEVADRVIKAISRGYPEKLARTRVNRSVARGSIVFPNNSTKPAGRVAETVYPDHARVVYSFDENPEMKQTYGLNSPFGWQVAGNLTYVPSPSPATVGRILTNDLLAEHWLPLGIALTDPKAVYFEANSRKGDKGPVTTVKYGLEDQHVIYLLTVDDQSDLIKRIEYSPVEDTEKSRINKIVLFPEHQAFDGYMLPTRMENYQKGTKVYSWSFTAWEFPEKLDPDLFNPPKK